MAKFIGIGINEGPDIDDDFNGGNDRDYLFGNIGNDTLSGGDGVDTMDGGSGDSDWVSFADATGGAVIDLTPVAFQVESITLADLSEPGIELIGFEGATATIVGSFQGRTDVARVVKADDAGAAAGTTMAIGANDSIDTIAFTASSTTMTLRVWVPKADIVVRLKVEDANDVTHTCEADALTTVSEGWETLTFDFANAATNQGNPTAALNLNYTYNKASVFFNFGVDGESGGGGTYYFDDLKFISDEGATGTITDDGFGNAETVKDVENVLGSEFADQITGNADGNTLSGGAGKDTINGGDGVDRLDGGAGTDTLAFSGAEQGVEVVLATGDLVTEVVNFEESTAPTFAVFGPDDNPAAASASIADDPEGGSNQVGKFVKGPGAFTWAGAVVATGENNSVTTLPFTADDNTMTMRVWAAEAGVEVLLKLEDADESAHNVGATATTTEAGEWQTLTFTFDEALPGPGTGALNLDYTYNKAVVFFNFGLDGDTGGGTFYFDDLEFQGSAVSTVADDGFGNAETVNGFENVVGSDFADKITGDAGNSVLEGGGGADTLKGGNGADSLAGGSAGDSLEGGSGDDTLSGNNGNDKLYGAENVDQLTGGDGNDTLDGGGSADSMTGGAGNDFYVVQNTGDKTVEAAKGGTDSVSSSVTFTLAAEVENLTLTGSSVINGTGNDSANSITGNAKANQLSGDAGVDTLKGGDGADTLTGGSAGDSLDGGAGADRMVGGTGGDTYVVQNSGDAVVENADEGNDLVKSSINHTLADNVEKLTLTGSGDINGHGNSLANTLVGNDGDNLLRGSTGNDTLTGGAGEDVFRFSSALNGSTNVDTILDFKGADDTIELENSVFLKLTSTGVLKAANFRASTSGNANEGNDHVLYETDTGKLFYDADGNGAGAKVLVATLTDMPSLAAADIFVT